MPKLKIRPIEAKDNQQIGEIIYSVIEEFELLELPGSVVNDPSLYELSTYFANNQGCYWVIVDEDEKVYGGGGFLSLEKNESAKQPKQCAVERLYFLPEIRHQGWGSKLFKLILNTAWQNGCREVFLSTSNTMTDAIRLYKKFKFKQAQHPDKNVQDYLSTNNLSFWYKDLKNSPEYKIMQKKYYEQGWWGAKNNWQVRHNSSDENTNLLNETQEKSETNKACCTIL